MRTTLVPLAITIALLSGCNTAVHRVSDEFTLSSDWSGFERMIVRSRNGSVDVSVVEGSQVRVSGEKWVRGATVAEAQARLEEMEIHAGAAPDDPTAFLVEARHPDFPNNASPGAKFVIELPHACPVSIDTSNGAVSVRNLSGEVRIHTGNGAVVATDIDGSVDIESSNGRITVRNVIGDTRVKTSNGAVKVTNVQGGLEASSSNGAIGADVTPPADSRVVLHSSNGSIRLTVPADLPADLHLDTSNGRIHWNLDSVTPRTTAGSSIDTHKKHLRELNASINGGGCRIEATTSNGSITLSAK